MRDLTIYTLIVVLFFISCKSNNNDYEKDSDKIKVEIDSNIVDAIILKKEVFYKELVSNGKLVALQKTDLRFETQGKLLKIYKHNGSYVSKNGTIASLDAKKAYRDLDLAKLDLKKAKILLDQQLIGHGFSPTKTDSVPAEIMTVAKISSGYSSAEINLQKAQNEINNLDMKAPFSGKVANIEKQIFEDVSASEDFCSLIDDSKFLVEFTILEGELNQIRIGEKVVVTPFSLKNEYQGSIKEINPVVDENGMIKVKAVIINNDHKLMEGMNVDVRIRRSVPNQLIVPKDAVVIRDDLEVLFRYTHGIAYWTYIKIIDENSEYYDVIANKDRSATLKAGDTIIVTNNLNLAHESKVKIRKIIKK